MRPVRHRHRVVDDTGDQPAVRVVQLRAAADRRHVHALLEAAGADESAHELDRSRGRRVAVPVEDDLGPHEEGRVALGRELDRPALAGAVAQARAPAREAQVGRVVVGGLVSLRRCLAHDRPDQAVDARHLEVGRRGELQLAFRAVLHGRLSVAPCDCRARGARPRPGRIQRRARRHSRERRRSRAPTRPRTGTGTSRPPRPGRACTRTT